MRSLYRRVLPVTIAAFCSTIAAPHISAAPTYTIVDTGQTIFYGNNGEITEPGLGDAFYGQDAHYAGTQPSYSVINNGAVVQDNNTGLFWGQSIDVDGIAGIDANDRLTSTELTNYVAQLNANAFGGRTDWRVPSVKELYSLILFDGIQPRPNATTGTGGNFFLDGSVFDFEWGDVASGDRIIDSQVWSSTNYTSTTMAGDQSFLSVNFADGRIKGYPLQSPGSGADNDYYAMVVAGNSEYGINDYQDNEDGTITDLATNLEWTQQDSSTKMNWEEALGYVEDRNAENYLGHNDWRLPNAKELQSLVDYSRSPDATGTPAIDPIFDLTATQHTAEDFTNANGDYGFHWTGTTFLELNQSDQVKSDAAVYISFFEALGSPNNSVLDVHGAGSQRTDPKSEGFLSPGDFFGPQGDYISIDNYVLLVRDADNLITLAGDFNEDGVVDLADYTVWRNNLGAEAGTLPNDSTDGEIGTAQYQLWKSNFGASFSPGTFSAAVTAVPEPASFTLMLAMIFAIAGGVHSLRYLPCSSDGACS